MRPSSSIKIISDNKVKKDKHLKAQNLEAENRKREIELENSKKEQKLKEENDLLVKRKVNYLEEEKRKSLEDIQQIKNPVVISFAGDESLAGYKYVELKQRVHVSRSNMLEARVEVLNPWYIWFAKLSGTLFFIFILTRLAGEERDLIASFTFITIFQSILGETDMTLFIDFFCQDIPLVTAISFLIAVGFKDYENFYENKTRTNLYILFGMSICGLFLSSMLFAY